MNFSTPGFYLFAIVCCIYIISTSNASLLDDEQFLISAPTAENFGKRIRTDAIRKRKRVNDSPDNFDETDPRYSKLAPSAYLPPTEELNPFSTVQDPKLSYPSEPQASSIDAQAAEAPALRVAPSTDGTENAKDDQCAHSFHSFLCRKPGNIGNRRLKVKQPVAPEASFPRPTKVKPPLIPKITITTTSQRPALEESNAEFGATFIQPARVNPPANTPNCSSNIHVNKPQIPLAYFSTTFPPRVSSKPKQKNIVKVNENNNRPYTTRQTTRKPIYADATFQQPSRLPPPLLDHKNCTSKDHSVLFKPSPTIITPQLRLQNQNCSTHNSENDDVQATFLNSARVPPPEEKKSIVPQPDTISSKQLAPKEQESRVHPFHSVLCKTGNSNDREFPIRKSEPGTLAGDSSFVDSSIVLPPSTTQKPKPTTTPTLRVPTTEKLIEPQAAQNPTSVIAIPPVASNHNHDHHGRDICSDPFHSFLCQTVDPRNRRRKYGKSPANARPTLEEANPTGDNTFVYSERVPPPPASTEPPTTQRTKPYIQPQFLVSTTYSPPFVPRVNTPSILDIIPKTVYQTTHKQPCDHPTTPFSDGSLSLPSQRKETNPTGDNTFVYLERVPPPSVRTESPTTQRTKTYIQPQILVTTTYSPPFVPRAKVNTPSILDIIPKTVYQTTHKQPCDHPTTPFSDGSLSLPSQRKNFVADSSSQFQNKLPIQNKISLPPPTTTTTTTTTTPRPIIRFTTPAFILHPDGSICKNPNEHLPEVSKTLDPAASFISSENILPARSDSLRLSTTTVRTTTRASPTTKQSEVEPQAAQNPETIVRQNNPDHDHEHHHHHHEGDICKDPFHSFLCEPIKPRRRFDGQPQSSAPRPSFQRGPTLRGESSLTQSVKLPPPVSVVNSRNAPTSINDQIDFSIPPRNSQMLPQLPPTTREAFEPTNTQNVILLKDIPNTFPSQRNEGNVQKISNPDSISPKQSDIAPAGSSTNQLFGSTGYTYPRPQNELNYPKRNSVSSLRRLSRNPVELQRENIGSNVFDSTTQVNGRLEDTFRASNKDPITPYSTNKDVKKVSRLNSEKLARWSWSPTASASS